MATDVATMPAAARRNADRDPGGIAVISAGTECTHAELARAIDRCAAALGRLGVRSGSRVGLLCPNRLEWIVAAYGAMSLGATVAAFNTWSKRWDLDHLLRHSKCEVLVSVAGFGDTHLLPLLAELLPEVWDSAEPGWRSGEYPDLRELVLITDDQPPNGARSFPALLSAEADAPAAPDAATADGVAMVLYTSGSTARPKAVQLTHGATVEHAVQVAERMGVRPGDRILVPVPLFWSYGGANALAVSLVTGSAILLQETFDAGVVLDLVERHGCTVAYTLPNITQALLAHPSFAPERVRSLRGGMTIGAARDVRAAAEELTIGEICNAYGSTELYGGAAVTPHTWSVDHRCTSQGLPLPGMQVRILDPSTGEEMPAGEPGEIVVSGHVTPGYLDQPAETSAAFTGDGAFRTGDLGYLDEDGELHFVGRASEMIRTGGINISPLEVEDFLLAHPGVQEAVVVGAEDEARGQVAVAFVRVAAPDETDEEQLRAFCRDRIASYKVPARIVVTTEGLPRTTTGKVARADLRADAARIWRD